MSVQGADFRIVPVGKPGADLDAVRDLFVEYGASLDSSLCLQGFDQELATLPGAYAPPRGILLLAKQCGEAAGCVAVRPLDDQRCEMKRLYVRPEFQGTGLGRRLAERAIDFARSCGYHSIALDTLPDMHAARALYGKLGFRPCAPYYDNSSIGSDCFELII